MCWRWWWRCNWIGVLYLSISHTEVLQVSLVHFPAGISLHPTVCSDQVFWLDQARAPLTGGKQRKAQAQQSWGPPHNTIIKPVCLMHYAWVGGTNWFLVMGSKIACHAPPTSSISLTLILSHVIIGLNHVMFTCIVQCVLTLDRQDTWLAATAIGLTLKKESLSLELFVIL